MWEFYLDEADPNAPYLVKQGTWTCWYTVANLEQDLHYVWNKDKHPEDECIERKLVLLGEYEDLNTLKMLHLMEK